MARTWPLRYLIRHTAYHTLDHTWEMEDKDLTAKRAQVPGVTRLAGRDATALA